VKAPVVLVEQLGAAVAQRAMSGETSWYASGSTALSRMTKEASPVGSAGDASSEAMNERGGASCGSAATNACT